MEVQSIWQQDQCMGQPAPVVERVSRCPIARQCISRRPRHALLAIDQCFAAAHSMSHIFAARRIHWNRIECVARVWWPANSTKDWERSHLWLESASKVREKSIATTNPNWNEMNRLTNGGFWKEKNSRAHAHHHHHHHFHYTAECIFLPFTNCSFKAHRLRHVSYIVIRKTENIWISTRLLVTQWRIEETIFGLPFLRFHLVFAFYRSKNWKRRIPVHWINYIETSNTYSCALCIGKSRRSPPVSVTNNIKSLNHLSRAKSCIESVQMANHFYSLSSLSGSEK